MKLLIDKRIALADAEAFAALPEYSCSLPTGVRPGKRWKRARNTRNGDDGWLLGECHADSDPDYLKITFKPLEVV